MIDNDTIVIIDKEVRLNLGPYHLSMWRDNQTDEKYSEFVKELPFVLRHAERVDTGPSPACDGDVSYYEHKTDAALNSWNCRRCGKSLFTDFDLKTMSLVRMKQVLYVARQYSSSEEIQKMDFNNAKGHGYHFARPMTKDELKHYHKNLIEASVTAYRKFKGK
jgi:hypothetical protein